MRNISLLTIRASNSVFALFFIAHRAHAQSNNEDPFGLKGAVAGSGIVEAEGAVIVANIITSVMFAVGATFLALMIWAGVSWMNAAGNEEIIKTAKKTLTGAVIGLIITLLAYLITYNLVLIFSTAATTPV